jgi:hypothetical protein
MKTKCHKKFMVDFAVYVQLIVIYIKRKIISTLLYQSYRMSQPNQCAARATIAEGENLL